MAELVRGKIKSVGAAIMETKALDTGEFRISGWASKPSVDRMREVVEAGAFKGTLESFKRNPIMLFMHDVRQPIGRWDSLEVRQDGLWVSGVIGYGFEPADKARAMIEQGILRALSIGFREVIGEVDSTDGLWHFREIELLEISPVGIPANRDALMTMDNGKLVEIKELPEPSDEELQQLFIQRGTFPKPAPVSAPRADVIIVDDLNVTPVLQPLVAKETPAPSPEPPSPDELKIPLSKINEILLPHAQAFAKQATVLAELQAAFARAEARIADLEAGLVALLDLETEQLAERAGISRSPAPNPAPKAAGAVSH